MNATTESEFDEEAQAFMRSFLHAARNAMQQSQSALSLLRLEAAGHSELQQLIDEVEGGGATLARLFDAARRHVQPLRPSPARFDVVEVVRQAWRDSLPPHTSASLSVTPESLCWLLDLTLFDEALRALFRNASEARPEGLEVRVELRHAGHDGGDLTLSVEDNGPGVDEHQVERMLEPFWSTRSDASGMGLPRARRIVEAHGGSLLVQRADGGGVRVLVFLPAAG